MQFTEIIIIFTLVLVAWFWFDSAKVIEMARINGSKMCNNNNVQFLDETVHQTSFRLAKNSYGQLKFFRTFQFEFTNNEYQRVKGELIFAGSQLISSHMDPYRVENIDHLL